eukprot:CAMPEP_0115018904 /NCGR_PEP_ID=MMETSP0216-20121206/29113_1 /TAXON_ID=223996 /ORGANISM="Protocruzia adherens, Strain Boccale" /LENGTH=248 /DNA_ID=CAMNT_0002390247 /DNA_START=116 /DNA_END=862 /DNA_ORIENTATION=+
MSKLDQSVFFPDQLDDSQIHEGIVCRICLDAGEGPESEMCIPCKCVGSVRYIHVFCLKEWIRERGSLNCEICHTQYKERWSVWAYAHNLIRDKDKEDEDDEDYDEDYEGENNSSESELQRYLVFVVLIVFLGTVIVLIIIDSIYFSDSMRYILSVLYQLLFGLLLLLIALISWEIRRGFISREGAEIQTLPDEEENEDEEADVSSMENADHSLASSVNLINNKPGLEAPEETTLASGRTLLASWRERS